MLNIQKIEGETEEGKVPLKAKKEMEKRKILTQSRLYVYFGDGFLQVSRVRTCEVLWDLLLLYSPNSNFMKFFAIRLPIM